MKTNPSPVLDAVHRFAERSHPLWLSFSFRSPGEATVSQYQFGDEPADPRGCILVSRALVAGGVTRGRIEVGLSRQNSGQALQDLEELLAAELSA